MQNNFKLFTFESSKDFAASIANHLNISLGRIKERDFEDGEHKARPLENVRNRDVFVIQNLYKDNQLSINDKLVRLLFFIGALKDASARSVNAVVPYLCYSRKDRKTKSRDPVTTKYVANLLKSVGLDRIITVDVHNLQAYQNAFQLTAEHLEARIPFVEHIHSRIQKNDEITVMSPDVGGVKRANHFKNYLEQVLNKPVKLGLMEKERSMGKVTGEMVVGEYEDRTIIIVDDLVSSGTTLARAAKAAKEKGAKKVYAMVTHGIFVGNANEIIADPHLDKLFITNTLPPFRLKETIIREKVEVVDISGFIANAIKIILSGGSLVDLNQEE